MLLLIALLIVAAVFSTKITSRFGIPILLVFLGLGMLVGSDVLNLIYFDDAVLAQQVANLALIFILFEGGCTTRRSTLRLVLGPALTLATAGIIITALVLGLLIYGLTDFSLLYALMIGAIISSTDAAAVLMMLRQRSIRPIVAATLEVESAANDPAAILLTVLFIQILTGETQHVGAFALKFFWQLGGGIGMGYLVSKIGVWLFNTLDSDNRGDYYVLSLGVSLLAFGLADVIHANGMLAVFFGGYWLGNAEFSYKRGVSHFIEGIASFSNVALFLLLGLLVFPKDLRLAWKEGSLIALSLIFIARPVAVLLCTVLFRFNRKERLFIMWGGIKGAVPIVLATYPAVYGLDQGHFIFHVVFFAVVLSCLLQGTTLSWMARKLRLTIPARPKSLYSIELLTKQKSAVEMFEVQIEDAAHSIGQPLKHLQLPKDVLITAIVRANHLFPPKGDAVIQAHDILFVLAPAADIEALSAQLNQKQEEPNTLDTNQNSSMVEQAIPPDQPT